LSGLPSPSQENQPWYPRMNFPVSVPGSILRALTGSYLPRSEEALRTEAVGTDPYPGLGVAHPAPPTPDAHNSHSHQRALRHAVTPSHR
jgi:hypothetical protein